MCNEQDPVPLHLTMRLLGSNLGLKGRQGSMNSEIFFLIEGYWRTIYFIFIHDRV